MKNDIKINVEKGKRKEEKDWSSGPSVFRESSLRYAALLGEQPVGLWSSAFHLLTLAVFLISAIFFSSCEDVIEVKLNDETLNLIGVEASITTNNQPSVFLYQTLKVNRDEAYPGVSGAVVTVSDNASPANSIILVEDQQKKGFYRVPQYTSYLGVPGREYTLTIQTQDLTLTAKDKLSRVEPIDSIQVFPSVRGDKLFLGIFTYGKEPKGTGNFYKWDIYVNDTLINNADRLAIASDELVDGNYISKLEIYTDFHDPKKPEERNLKLNDTITVRQTSISEFAYNFYFQMINQSSTGSLFSVPPANIKSNFSSSNGKPVLGLFTARDVSVSNQVVIDQSIEKLLKKLP
jgi:hypothetical protein